MKCCISLSACLLIGAGALLTGCGKEVKLEHRGTLYPNSKNVKEEWTITRTPSGDTLENGVHRKYFWSGSPSESVIWKMGVRDGSAQAYYEDGAVKWQKNYVNGKKQGTQRLNFKGGHPWIVATYDQDVLKDTVQVWNKDDVGSEPKQAVFNKGTCTGGDCALLEVPPIPADLPADKKTEATRDRDIIQDFLN